MADATARITHGDQSSLDPRFVVRTCLHSLLSRRHLSSVYRAAS
jgi:hypothetical protein